MKENITCKCMAKVQAVNIYPLRNIYTISLEVSQDSDSRIAHSHCILFSFDTIDTLLHKFHLLVKSPGDVYHSYENACQNYFQAELTVENNYLSDIFVCIKFKNGFTLTSKEEHGYFLIE